MGPKYTLVKRYCSHCGTEVVQSRSGKNFKRLEKTGTGRFGKIFLNTWTSKTYTNISKKQHRQVLPVHT